MNNEIAYELSYSPQKPPLQVRFSANAWWMDRLKIARLIAGLEIGKSLPDSCKYAGVSLRQYKYFLDHHPDFNLLRNYVNNQVFRAIERSVINRAMYDPRFAFRYLERTDPGLYKTRYATVPFCLKCQKEIKPSDLTTPYKKAYEKLTQPPATRKDPLKKFKVKDKKAPENPILIRLAIIQKQINNNKDLEDDEKKEKFEKFYF